MTIKPRNDAEKENQVVVVDQPNMVAQQNVVVRSVSTHRNVVIDPQSSQIRGDVYEELARHARRSPHRSNSTRVKRDHLHKRGERDKLANNVTANAAAKAGSPLLHGVDNGGNSPGRSVGRKSMSPERIGGLPVGHVGHQNAGTQHVANPPSQNKAIEEQLSGYNSGDEHVNRKAESISVDEWVLRDEEFAKCMSQRGYVLKPVEEDGACLFRAISLQIYGDEGMHDEIRQHTMDYIYKNREYFCHFVTEDINNYIKRKRRTDSHGNHIEIQAMSEIYSRPVEVYCYKPTPINIFNSEQLNNGYAPLRLSYQRGSHYNAIIDPYNATVGVGLGLAGYKPDLQTKEAARLSEQLEIEQTMFEDKLKTTDWEATNEAIEEQIARESYLQWCRENLERQRNNRSASTSATVTSSEAQLDALNASPSKYASVLKSCTVTAGEGQANESSGSASGSPACLSSSMSSSNSSLPSCSTARALFEHKFSLSPKMLASRKKDAGSSELGGYESDDTDISSTSSMGRSARSVSPSSAVLSKKPRTGPVSSSGKRKRRKNASQTRSATSPDKNSSELRKSPKREATVKAAAVKPQRAYTPEAEQQPCTSKQFYTSDAPQQKQHASHSKNGTPAADAQAPSSSFSNFYEELLQASYAADDEGVRQLSESEMLQRAIQMSRQDYIEDQKKKFVIHP